MVELGLPGPEACVFTANLPPGEDPLQPLRHTSCDGALASWGHLSCPGQLRQLESRPWMLFVFCGSLKNRPQCGQARAAAGLPQQVFQGLGQLSGRGWAVPPFPGAVCASLKLNVEALDVLSFFLPFYFFKMGGLTMSLRLTSNSWA